MTSLDILEARMARGRAALRGEERPILQSARDLLEAATAAGASLTLNPVQTAALWYFLDGIEAAQELARACTEPARAEVPAGDLPDNVVRGKFPS